MTRSEQVDHRSEDHERSPRTRSWWPRLVRSALYIGGGAALALALVNTWERRGQVTVFPQWERLLLALVLLIGAVKLASHAWLSLFHEIGDHQLLRNTFYLSQLGKYVPGMVWQPASVIALAPEAGVGTGRASTAVGVFTLAGAISAAVVASPLGLMTSDLPPAVRWVTVLGIATTLLLRRGWMERVVHGLAKRIRGFDSDGVLPSQQSIAACAAAAAGNVTLQGIAFAVLIADTAPNAPIASVVPAFALAWLVGFLIVPIPAGVGLREAVLVATLGASAGGRAVLAAAVLHRLVAIAAEAIMIVVSRRPSWTALWRQHGADDG